MELGYVKAIGAVSLLVLTVFFCSLPLCLFPRTTQSAILVNRRRKYRRVLNLLSCFGGGVFFGTFLLHLLPDVKEQVDKVLEPTGMKVSFPVDTFLVGVGYLFMLGVERVILASQRGNSLPFVDHSHEHDEPEIRQPSYGATSNSAETSGEHSIDPDESSYSTLSSLILIFALSLHSIFEGLAIGLQTTTQNVISILLAVLVHKSIIAFTLGLNLVDSLLRKVTVIQSIALFSAMSPLGTVVGLLVMDVGTGVPMDITSAILQGLACGTFVYVIFSEILPHALKSLEDVLWKVLFVMFGFSVIALLVLYLPS